MEAKELRIGNLVKGTKMGGSSYDGMYFIVLTISTDSVKVAPEKAFLHLGQGGPVLPPAYLCGIPITPEWLERLDFQRSEKDWVHRLGLTLGTKYNAEETPYFMTRGTLAEIKYIHQLQNLYFALTGEELALKEVVK